MTSFVVGTASVAHGSMLWVDAAGHGGKPDCAQAEILGELAKVE
jgi:hypothetical protein